MKVIKKRVKTNAEIDETLIVDSFKLNLTGTLFYFISIFILLTRKKAIEALFIGYVITPICQDIVVRLKFFILVLYRQQYTAVWCVSFEPRPCRS